MDDSLASPFLSLPRSISHKGFAGARGLRNVGGGWESLPHGNADSQVAQSGPALEVEP